MGIYSYLKVNFRNKSVQRRLYSTAFEKNVLGILHVTAASSTNNKFLEESLRHLSKTSMKAGFKQHLQTKYVQLEKCPNWLH